MQRLDSVVTAEAEIIVSEEYSNARILWQQFDKCPKEAIPLDAVKLKQMLHHFRTDVSQTFLFQEKKLITVIFYTDLG